MAQTIIHVPLSAPEAQTVLDGLADENAQRYGTDRPGSTRDDFDRYPATAFVPPLGDFVVLLQDGMPVAGGGFMSHDDETGEIKRVWTHPEHRRHGLARRITAALEDSAASLGYTRACLSVGFQQPEVVALYLGMGYRPIFDVSADPDFYRSLPFEKHIGTRNGQPSRSAPRHEARSFEEASAEVEAIKASQKTRILQRLAAHAALQTLL